MQNFFVDEGNLGADPVLKYVPVSTPKGVEQRAVLELQVRFDVRKKRGEAYEDVGGFWAKVTQWGRRAEINNQFLVQGCRVLVVGQISQHPYIIQNGDRKGQPSTAIEIEADSIGLVLWGIEEITFQEKSQRNEVDTPQHDSVAESDSIPFEN